MPAFQNRIAAISTAAAISLALIGCQKPADKGASAAPSWKLDESQLIQPIAFGAADIDASKNVCKDLNANANDRWLAANPIPADKSSWGAFQVLAERSLQVRHQLAEQAAAQANPAGLPKIIADFWATGMDEKRLNEQGMAPLKERLAEIDQLADGASVAAYLRKVAARGENPLFGFSSDADFNESTMNIAYAEQGGTNLPDKEYYFKPEHKDTRDAYLKHIAKVLEISGVNPADAATQAADIMKFETRLAKASKSTEDLQRDVKLYYNPVTLADADKLTPNFPWSEFFKSQGVAAPAKFSLAMPEFHQEVSRMLTDVPVAGWKTYLRFQQIEHASPYLSDAFVNERFEFYNKTLRGQQELAARWKRVLSTIESSAGEAMGQLYVQVAYPPESKQRMEKLVGDLTSALKTRIEKLTWMSDATRAKALDKWSKFTPKIGYPVKWREWDGLGTNRDSYFGNAMAAQEFNYRWEIGKIGKPVDRTEWGMTPQTVNAYYNPQMNEIVFPAAILQPPFFDPKADDAVNYGAIGAVIGHELTHGYDDQGARFGPTGNFEEWWTDADKKQFQALTGKLVQQYNGYTMGPGLKVNGNLTLGENIADLGGISIAYDALQHAVAGQADPKVDGLTRDQRFFYGFATVWRSVYKDQAIKVQLNSDPHAPARIRTNGTVANHPAFAAAFGCKDGDAMVSGKEKRVVIW
jgi:putative endopeptidase